MSAISVSTSAVCSSQLNYCTPSLCSYAFRLVWITYEHFGHNVLDK